MEKTTSTKQDNFLEELRNLYRSGDMVNLKRKYNLGKWKLTPEKRIQIYKILYPNNELVDIAIKEYGCKKVDT